MNERDFPGPSSKSDRLETNEEPPTSSGAKKPRGWVALIDAPGERLERKFGWFSERLGRALLEKNPERRAWLLDKKVFRRAQSEVLPPRHDVVEVARDPLPTRRAARAARAHERLLRATDWVPELPFGAPETRLLVWASPVAKPRAIRVEGFRFVREIEKKDLATTVCAFWSGLYFDEYLRDLPRDVTRLEMAIGAVELGDDHVEALAGLFESERARATSSFPGFGWARGGIYLSTLEASVVEREERALLSVIEPSFSGDLPHFVEQEAGRFGVAPEVPRALSARARSELERAVLLDLLGSPVLTPNRPLVLEKSPLAWMHTGRKFVERFRSVSELERLVARQERDVDEKRTWMKEFDLGVLPDDGLRRTLEELGAVLDSSARLSAEVTWAAQFQLRVAHALTGVDLDVLDAGLDVPGLEALRAFERTLDCVRSDPVLKPTLSDVGALPRGPGERALTEFVGAYGEYFPPGDVAIPALVWRLVQAAWSMPSRVDEAHAAARAQAERVMTAAEASLSRFLAPLATPLRTQARELVRLRERARSIEVRVESLLARVFADVDRRLPRLDLGLLPGSAYHTTWGELIEVIDLRGSSLRERTSWRRAAEERTAASEASGARKGELRIGGFQGIGVRRNLPAIFALPARTSSANAAPFAYGGRVSDSVPTLARALGVEVMYGAVEDVKR